MNFTTYLETVRFRAARLDPLSELFHAKLGLVTEAGEICDLYKRQLAYGTEFNTVGLLEECGDWFWYFCLYCDNLGLPMIGLESKAHSLSQNFVLEREMAQAPGKLSLTLAVSTASFCDAEDLGLSPADAYEMADASFSMVVWFLLRYGFTVSQCLDANDAKLGKRTGKSFSAERILGRDTAAEREVLEGHAKDR